MVSVMRIVFIAVINLKFQLIFYRSFVSKTELEEREELLIKTFNKSTATEGVSKSLECALSTLDLSIIISFRFFFKPLVEETLAKAN